MNYKQSKHMFAFLMVFAIVAFQAADLALAEWEVTSVNAVGYIKISLNQGPSSLELGSLGTASNLLLTTGDDLVQSTDTAGKEINTVSAALTGRLTTIDTEILSMDLSGTMQMGVIDKYGNATGSWDTEIVSMSLSGDIGGVPVLIRESPAAASTGHVTVLKLEDSGFYYIDSFFDVWTELSVDGGDWIASPSPIHFRLIPEPATILLLAGGIGFLTRRRPW